MKSGEHMKFYLFAFLFAFGNVHAEEFFSMDNTYLGVSIMNSTYEDPDYQSMGTRELKDSSTNLRLSFGKNITEQIAVETTLGRISSVSLYVEDGDTFTRFGTQETDDSTFAANSRVTWLGFNAIYGKNITDSIRPFAKLGFGFWEDDVAVSASGLSFSDKDDGFDLNYAAGVSYAITSKYDVSFEYEVYRPGVDVDALTLSVKYNF